MKPSYGSKLIYFLLAICLLHSSVAAQGLLQRQISLDMNKQPLAKVLERIGEQGAFYFSYNSNLINSDSLISLSVKNKSVKQVLLMLLGENCQFIETDKHIILQPGEREKWYTITGYIRDGSTGDALPDVSIFERQQLASALSGKDGFFMLKLKDRERYRNADITISKGFYVDTNIILAKGFDQEVALAIVPETYALPGAIITQNSGIERSWFGKFLISSKLKTQSLNLRKFFVDKPYQFSLIPGLGTHGKMSGQVVNKVSFNLLGGYTAGANGLELAGLFNIDKKDVKYVQLAGILNVVLGNTEGVQLAGISNYIEGEISGVQMAGIINKAGRVDGVQMGGCINMAFDSVNGTQLAGMINGSKFANVQTAGFINFALGVEGIQLAGFVNLAKEVKGVQVAGFVNMAKKIKGQQIAGFVNMAQDVDGVQTAGFINIARKVKGVQIAGLINIAKSSDYPIGLINIIRDGDKSIGLTYDEFGVSMVGFRSGGRVLYGILGVGGKAQFGQGYFAAELGFGARAIINRYFCLRTELATMILSNGLDETFRDNALRIMPALKFGPVEVFAGAGLNFATFSWKPEYAGIKSYPFWEGHRSGNAIDMRIGYRAGVLFHF